MNTSPLTSHVAAASEVPLSIIGRFVVAHMVDNFDHSDLEALETRLLEALSKQRKLQGVIFNFSEVLTTDRHDLQRLQSVFTAIKLMGGRVGLCGINPGLASVIVNAGMDFQHEMIGLELADLMPSL